MNRENINDDVLGHLGYDERLKWYTGQWNTGSAALGIYLNLDESGSVESALARARQILSSLDRHAEGAKEYAVSELLTLKNENWLDDDEREVTPAEFRSRMNLRDIVFDPDGKVTFYHNDGDLFAGHSIEIRMDGRDFFHHADIPG